MKREIARPRDFTPEYVAEEIREQIMLNPFIMRYDYERKIRPDEVPTIVITLELMVSKNAEITKEDVIDKLNKI